MLKTKLVKNFEKIWKDTRYRSVLLVLGCLSLIFVCIRYVLERKNSSYDGLRQQIIKELNDEKIYENLEKEMLSQMDKRNLFFDKKSKLSKDITKAKITAKNKFDELVEEKLQHRAIVNGIKKKTFVSAYEDFIGNPVFLIFSFIVSFPMYILIFIFSSPMCKYVFERLLMMIFVIFGVTFIVFTILYFSPMDPARNILGQTATIEQIEVFNEINGLDKPYLVRLFTTFKDLITFDLGNSYVGNLSVSTEIGNRFPVTLIIAFWSLVVSVGIAVPSGIVSAIKQYSSFDYIFMFIALIGLSVPNFWLALILILEFSIKLNWLPATFIPGNWVTLIMPAFVLGTGMAASVARMTRSSMLEVKNADYILTAKAKGLSSYKVTIKHILGNAMIPIVTVIGLQFGGMLGGSAVTEKGFNINGLGSFIVDRQFIPDIPVVMAGVIYIAFVISLVNLFVDILYAFLDPRIKSKMKNY